MSLAANDPRPPYVQVADELRRDIDSGVLAPKERLPSIRALADRFGVAQMTVQNALRFLRDEGFIETTPNRGSFVAQGGPKGSADGMESLAREVRSLREDYKHLSQRLAALEDRN